MGISFKFAVRLRKRTKFSLWLSIKVNMWKRTENWTWALAKIFPQHQNRRKRRERREQKKEEEKEIEAHKSRATASFRSSVQNRSTVPPQVATCTNMNNLIPKTRTNRRPSDADPVHFHPKHPYHGANYGQTYDSDGHEVAPPRSCEILLHHITRMLKTKKHALPALPISVRLHCKNPHYGIHCCQDSTFPLLRESSAAPERAQEWHAWNPQRNFHKEPIFL